MNDDEYTNYQSRHESQDEHGVVRGQYSYVAPNGVRITVTYTADAVNGYQVGQEEVARGRGVTWDKECICGKKVGWGMWRCPSQCMMITAS